ncbi:hypothetical protein L6452_37400 [Arctium lappa]|uniref:Uncharacterized protein n=1 Tax=Arctium lappa TaxID=4217 RepID=A0ACB8Y721_ARCLA|nr:hypothetical protein L6452_37400 [Arctium lappa]
MNMNMDMDIYPHLYPDDDDDNDMLTPVSLYVWPCGTRVRVYSVSPIVSGDFHPEVLAQSLRFYRPLPYPYTWYVHGEEAAIVNIIDLQAHHQLHQPSSSYYQRQQEPMDHDHGYSYHYSVAIDDGGYESHFYPHSETIDAAGYETHPYQRSEYVDETAILEDLNMNQINESFEQASDQFVACSGLTNKLISKNLTVTKYHEEEESEVCVVCQVEFEKDERVGVLQCGHRFHPKCITEWLLRRNVCPLCMAQALKDDVVNMVVPQPDGDIDVSMLKEAD